MPDQPPEPNEPRDAELLRRYVERGDRQALESLLARHADLLYRTALRTTRNVADAQDAVQSAIVMMMRKAAKYRGGEGVSSWMARIVFTVACNMIRGVVRQRGREENAARDAEHVDGFIGANGREDRETELANTVKRTLDTLPDRYRLPIWLHHCEALPFRDIARTMGITEATARANASRGIGMLRAALAKLGVPVTAASLATVFGVMPVEAAPPTLLRSIGPIVESGGTSGVSPAAARLAARTGRTAPAWLAPTVATGIVACTTGAVGTILFLRDREAPAAPPAETVPVQPGRILYQWDFNAPPDPEVFRPVVGDWRFVPDGGPDGSGCMETETENDVFSFLLDLPLSDLPVLATWQKAPVMPEPQGRAMSTWTWESFDSAIQFYGMGDYYVRYVSGDKFRPGEMPYGWISVQCYVTEDFIWREVDSSLYSLLFSPRKPDARLKFAARGRMRIDNLTLRLIAADELPDIAPYLEAAQEVPTELRDGRRVHLPTLKPGKGRKQVEASFHPGHP